MNFDEIMEFLKDHENPNGKKVPMRHGARDPFYGVRIGDLKQVVKKVKKNHQLAMQLYATGNSDAFYLAGLIADETQMSKNDLQESVAESIGKVSVDMGGTQPSRASGNHYAGIRIRCGLVFPR